ncbi:MAG: hypothetical protein A2499_11400 [Stygiobacter sp. RIFOXYC12_FULL_38_8]|nr:MAG: hypothetical protein A2X62_02495 [Stygiobacter sp. GWC2_38_9]OGU79100.1 MAG: hypothetical protein A2279_03365 [Stygiobacter sp. RIFOXYA12_FULL_38_9]OGV09255.1 MAG: hypothetical protein A2299_08290 [Stygiobacter sp. RIFOXYB2_FULL_37_11]OGV09869.1 MAG: hypothetical protein A2237_03360 [Stygiobacter sp. RIFOXYA2_FULL_38_8]OGV16207.1 MAG: hypothetical protein A2440_04055 [Stygiobacter sp. RIFOXYC2_FULL_38_25]OGV22455.1 MAG: hypothetical protein A2499_11400 [Stygiobacter sp. RIFOXYC12_FULL_
MKQDSGRAFNVHKIPYMIVIKIALKKIKQKNNIFLKLLFSILILKLIKQLNNFLIKHSTDCLKNKNSLLLPSPSQRSSIQNFGKKLTV